MNNLNRRLIPESAQLELEKQDAQRAKARETASPDQFRRSFLSVHAAEIEAIRLGAIVTETDDEGRVTAMSLPNGKPVPTLVQATWTIRLSRLKRFFRRVGQAFINLVDAIKAAWRQW